MKTSHQFSSAITKIAALMILCLALFSAVFAQSDKGKAGKMTAEEVLSKHLASIGTPEALAAVKSRVMVGSGRLASKVGFSGQLSGPAQFASEGEKVMMAIIFNSNDYPYEKVGFDGDEISFGRPTIAQSELGAFLKSQKAVLQQGLFGGVLSSAWPLLSMSAKKAKLNYGGLVKMGGRSLHKLKYIPNRGGSLNIGLFFDADTFQHVMSQYEYTVPVQMGANIEVNSQAKPSYFTLVEQFSDFKTAGNLTLPFTYTIEISAQNKDEARQLQWTLKIGQVYYNESLEAGAFKVS